MEVLTGFMIAILIFYSGKLIINEEIDISFKSNDLKRLAKPIIWQSKNPVRKYQGYCILPVST